MVSRRPQVQHIPKITPEIRDELRPLALGRLFQNDTTQYFFPIADLERRYRQQHFDYPMSVSSGCGKGRAL